MISHAARQAVVAGVVTCAWLVAQGAPALAVERLINRYDTRHGLPVAHVLSLAQDARGFVWIGTMGGLVRFDGREMRPWLRDTLRGEILDIVTLPQNKLLVRTQSTLFEVDDTSAAAQYVEDGAPLSGASSAAVTTDGRAWAAAGGLLFARTATGRWRLEASLVFDGERVERVRQGAAGTMLVLTDRSLWAIAPHDHHATRLARLSGLVDVIPSGRGYLAVTFDLQAGRVVEIGETSTTRFELAGARPIALARRGDVVWVAFDRYLSALRPGQPVETLGPKEGISDGGPLLVDAEGSLWLGTFIGLLQLPEPETRSWTDLDGLPGPHTRALLSTDEGLWVASWQGLGRLVRKAGVWRALDERLYHHSDLCTDSAGTLIVMNQPNGPLYTRAGGRFVSHTPPDRDWLAGCARARDGGVWYATDRSIWIVADGARDARVIAPPPNDRGAKHYAMIEDRQGRLWVSGGEQVCHAEARALRAGTGVEWRCDPLAGARSISNLIETPSGALWAATLDAGVWRWQADRWSPLAATSQLPSNTMRAIRLAKDGTIWILGASAILRVREQEQAPGWSVVERLTAYHGLTSQAAEGVFEDEDGAVWLASTSGVTYVPSPARNASAPAPRAELVAALVNGQAHPVDRAVSMQSGDNSLELRFAVLTFRDRRRLQFQLRLLPGGQWMDSPGDDTTIRFLNLGAGAYTVEARASLDGDHWSDPVRLKVSVLEPWYRTWWAMSLGMLTILGLGAAWHRSRLVVERQLERQRTRIARDLHDELGSGLGSIGILAGVAAGSEVGEAHRRTMAATIADTAQDLSGGLSDLVWSLSSRAVTLSALAAHLAELGSRLFPGPLPRLESRFPSVFPSTDLPLLVRRNVTLIALEALRNAARHAHAGRVWLSLEPIGTSDWVLEVGDDGRGLRGETTAGESPLPDAGHGRENMSARAAEIGATLEWSAAPGGGTIVRLRFRPTAPRRKFGLFRNQ